MSQATMSLRWFSWGLDRLAIYLPVLLMGVLALGTYWLVRTTPVFSPEAPARAPRHEPDYFMRDFSVKTFDPAGHLKSELQGVEGRHYPDTDTLEVDQVVLRSYSPEGQVTVATAKHGLSNGDSTEVQLLGNAVVVREAMIDERGRSYPRMEFRGEFLHVYTDTEKVKSHLPVLLIRGEDHFTGDSMDFDNAARTIELHGRVHGFMMPGLKSPPGAAAHKP